MFGLMLFLFSLKLFNGIDLNSYIIMFRTENYECLYSSILLNNGVRAREPTCELIAQSQHYFHGEFFFISHSPQLQLYLYYTHTHFNFGMVYIFYFF